MTGVQTCALPIYDYTCENADEVGYSITDITKGRVITYSKAGVIKLNIHWPYVNIPDKNMNITIKEFKKITDVTIPVTSFVTTSSEVKHDLNPSVLDSDASIISPIKWIVVGENTHGVTFEDNKIVTNKEIEDTIRIKAIIKNALGYRKDFTKEFSIQFTK